MMMRRSRSRVEAGFTLIEVLAAFAISASIIVGVGSLLHHIGLSFDRGISGVNEAERFSLAMDRLSQDFAAARFISIMPEKDGERGAKASPQLVFKGGANKVTLVSASDRSAMRAEVVTFSVETFDDGSSQLVRRSAVWRGPGASIFADATDNTVVLLKGRYAISFNYGQLKNGTMSWSQSWQDEQSLPAAVRLSLRDPVSGGNLVTGADFILRADFPAGCAGDVECPEEKKKPAQGEGRETL